MPKTCALNHQIHPPTAPTLHAADRPEERGPRVQGPRRHRPRVHTIARPPLQRPVLEAVRGRALEVRHLQVGLRAELEIQELTERSRVMSWRIFCVAAVLAALGCGRTVPDDGCPDGVPPYSGAPQPARTRISSSDSDLGESRRRQLTRAPGPAPCPRRAHCSARAAGRIPDEAGGRAQREARTELDQLALASVHGFSG